MNGSTTLRTSRLELRLLTGDDVEAMHHLANIPQVAQFLWDGQCPTRERVKEIMGAILEAIADGVPHWAVCDRNTGAFIGHCGLRAAEPRNCPNSN
jgi:RimJ/RimL family protein N-acetyltransferase